MYYLPKSSITTSLMNEIDETGPSWMTPIVRYLSLRELKDNRAEAHKIQVQAARFSLINSQLYKWSLGGPYLKCLTHQQGQCDAPNQAPDGVSSEGVTLRDWDSLTFSFSYLTPVPVFSFICTIFVITKKILLHIHYPYHYSGLHVLYIESHYFSIYKAYTYSKNTEISEAVR